MTNLPPAGPQPDVEKVIAEIIAELQENADGVEFKDANELEGAEILLRPILTDFARSVREQRDKVITDEMEALHKHEVEILNKWLSEAKAKLQPSPCKVYGHRMCDYSPPHDVQEGYCNTCSAEFSKGECDTGCCLACQREVAAYERGKGGG